MEGRRILELQKPVVAAYCRKFIFVCLTNRNDVPCPCWDYIIHEICFPLGRAARSTISLLIQSFEERIPV